MMHMLVKRGRKLIGRLKRRGRTLGCLLGFFLVWALAVLLGCLHLRITAQLNAAEC